MQLNTIARPLSAQAARRVPAARLASLASLFDPAAEIVSEAPARETAPALGAPVGDDEVLALVARRPCTVRDVASGLRLQPAEAIKLLEAMVGRRRVRTIRQDDEVFYIPAEQPADAG